LKKAEAMKLFYYKDREGNFGDDLNNWLWPQLLPKAFDHDDGVLFLGIGTILDDRVMDSPRYAVFGSGAGYGPIPEIDHRWKIYCVRGPRTARLLNLDPSVAITDPGLLVRALDLPMPAKRYKISFMPHHVSARRSLWKTCCRLSGIHYIDPRDSVERVLSDIRSSEVLATGAMHGAVIADALRVPWIPVKLYEHILDFKWHDWCESLELTYNPVTLERLVKVESSMRSKLDAKTLPIRFVGRLNALLAERDPVLSSDHVIERATERLLNLLVEVENDLAPGSLACL
jgi:succinoglycan biosynthesis protein ExoV